MTAAVIAAPASSAPPDRVVRSMRDSERDAHHRHDGQHHSHRAQHEGRQRGAGQDQLGPAADHRRHGHQDAQHQQQIRRARPSACLVDGVRPGLGEHGDAGQRHPRARAGGQRPPERGSGRPRKPTGPRRPR